MSETNSTGTVSSEPAIETEIEGVANTIGAAAAATGNKIAEEADAALVGAESVAGTVQSDLANHATSLQTAVDGLSAVASNSATVAAAVSPAAASTVSVIEQKIAAFAADIGADISALFSHLKF